MKSCSDVWRKSSKSTKKSYFSHSEIVYNAGRYNFEVLEWAVKEIVEEDQKQHEAEKKRKEQEEAQLKAANGLTSTEATSEQAKPSSPIRYLWLLLLIPLLTILAHRFLM